VLDRGFIFGDGVYEVIPVDTVDGVRAPFRAQQHCDRLQRSCDGIRMTNPYTTEQWLNLVDEIIERHPWERQSVYLQVTRGVAKRDHAFPTDVAPTVFMNTSPWPAIPVEQIERGVAVVTHADERWLHCDIKSVSLLGNVLMKQYAVDRGAFETVMLRDGFLTEASSANVMVVSNGALLAPRKSVQILPGITCDASYDLAREHGVALELRPISEKELRSADELWLSSSGREILPITLLDGAPVGSGRPGPVYRKMQSWFQAAKGADARRWVERKALRGGRGALAA
jgi:D-alanine transaminase